MSFFKRVLRGTEDGLAQQAFDYGVAAGLGVAGQQAMNAVTDGADPNPFLSGALMTPALTYMLRQGRAQLNAGTPRGGIVSRSLANEMVDNPYQRAALIGSSASMVGGLGTNLYNTIAGGEDIDPNIAGVTIGLLSGIAPITQAILSPRYMGSTMPQGATFVQIPSRSSGNYTYDSVNAPYSNYTGRTVYTGAGDARNQRPYKGY